jgi:hypothetical protein
LDFGRLTPGEVTATIRVHLANERRALERDMAVAWTTAALHRSKKMPRLNAFLSRFRRRRPPRPAVYAPEEMSPERTERIATLSRGLTLSPTDPYARPEEVS